LIRIRIRLPTTSASAAAPSVGVTVTVSWWCGGDAPVGSQSRMRRGRGSSFVGSVLPLSCESGNKATLRLPVPGFVACLSTDPSRCRMACLDRTGVQCARNMFAAYWAAVWVESVRHPEHVLWAALSTP
jgi:hypothetical protein